MSGSIEFDGLVVEGAQGVRILALPTAVLEALRYAEVIQFKAGDRVSRMRVANFIDVRDQAMRDRQGRDQAQEIREQASNAAQAADSWPSQSAPTREYGAPVLPITSPSPTPPPDESDPLDPANIPMRVHRGDRWENIYVTRSDYERYTQSSQHNAHEGDQK